MQRGDTRRFLELPGGRIAGTDGHEPALPDKFIQAAQRDFQGDNLWNDDYWFVYRL